MKTFKIEDELIEVEEDVVDFIHMMLDDDRELLTLLR